MLNMIVLASGRGSNLAAIQGAIESGELAGRIRGVISNKQEAAALAFAAAKGIPAIWLDPKGEDGRQGYESRLLREVERLGSDCLVLAGYMLILSGGFIRGYGKPILNIHPALLPAFPGTTAQRDALAYGVKYSGCTVHFVDEGMDTGPIIAQRPVPVLDSDDEAALSARILAEEHKLYVNVLSWLAQGKIQRQGRKVSVSD
jgi:phosphoribosylglycinamide formyltransferase-1